jgi:hypothetical protein
VWNDAGACRRYERSTPNDLSVATTVVPGVAPVERVTRVMEDEADVLGAGLELVEDLEALVVSLGARA